MWGWPGSGSRSHRPSSLTTVLRRTDSRGLSTQDAPSAERRLTATTADTQSLLLRSDPERLCDAGDPTSLTLHRGGKFSRAAGVDDLRCCPASVAVGTSGRIGARSWPLTASVLI